MRIVQERAMDSKAAPALPEDYERFQQQVQMAQPKVDKLLTTSILPQVGPWHTCAMNSSRCCVMQAALFDAGELVLLLQ